MSKENPTFSEVVGWVEIRETQHREHLKEAKQTVVGASRSLGIGLGSETFVLRTGYANPLPIYNLEMLPKHPACHRQDACATGIRVVGWVERSKPNIFGSLSIPQANRQKMAQVLFSRTV